jgi:protein TonB
MQTASTICGRQPNGEWSRLIHLDGVTEAPPSSVFWAASLALHVFALWLFMPVSWFSHPETEQDVVTLRFVSATLPQAAKSPPPPPARLKSAPAARPHFKTALAAVSVPPVVVPLPRFIVTSAAISPWSLCLPPKLVEPDPELGSPLLPPPKSKPLPGARPHFIPALAAVPASPVSVPLPQLADTSAATSPWTQWLSLKLASLSGAPPGSSNANAASGTPATSSLQEGASGTLDGSAGAQGNAPGVPGGSGTLGGGTDGAGGPLTIPAYRLTPLPAYPPLAKAHRWEGVTLLRVEVLTDGSVGKVVLLASSGHNELDQTAIRAVQGWKFEPAKRGDTTIASFIKVPIRFKIERSKA